MRQAIIWWIICLALGATGTVPAQDAGPAPPTVKVAVRVMDREGHPILALGPPNFRLSQDKQDVTIAQFLGPDSPVLIPLIMDTTGDTTWIDAMRRELVNFVEVLPPNVQLMVMTATEGLKVVQSNTADKTLLKQAILNYDIRGYPGFMENVLNVADYMNRLLLRHPIRVCPLIITDSDVYKYRKQYTTADFNTSIERYKDKLKETGVPLHVIRIPTGNTDTFSRTYEGAMRELARSTGGEAEFPLAVAGVSNALRVTLHRIHGTCFLGFTPDAKAGKEYKLKVRVLDGSGQELDVKLEHPKSFRLPK
jgi:VWFA-related protein